MTKQFSVLKRSLTWTIHKISGLVRHLYPHLSLDIGFALASQALLFRMGGQGLDLYCSTNTGMQMPRKVYQKACFCKIQALLKKFGDRITAIKSRV